MRIHPPWRLRVAELREVIGRRRSIRFLRPDMPVEPEKIQMMFEAARIATHWGNVQALRAVAIHRHSAPQEVLDALKAVVVLAAAHRAGHRGTATPRAGRGTGQPSAPADGRRRARLSVPPNSSATPSKKNSFPRLQEIKDFLKSAGPE
ncbi:MAG: nitroreductase family protein [Proteobacteria bacterium]|nr:nitroreductase family protein [Pseudomonadota bacterium]